MKIFGYYFYLAFLSATICLCMFIHDIINGSGNIAEAVRDPTRNGLIFCLHLIEYSFAFSIFFITRYFQERRWVTNLFIVYSISGILLEVIHDTCFSNWPIHLLLFHDHLQTVRWIYTLLYYLCIASFIIGSFGVRSPEIRKWMRWLTGVHATAVVTGLTLSYYLQDQTTFYQRDAIACLFGVPINLLFILMLHPIKDLPQQNEHWETAVESIGTPETL